MKKYLLFATILLQTSFLFGQSTQWGSWNSVDCFKGISFRCRVKDYNSSAKQYTWDVEIKNSYNTKVSLNFDIQNSSVDGRTSINAGGIDKSWTLNSSNKTLYITFSKVCFYHPNGFDQCSEYPNKNYAGFAQCDNGTPKYVKAGDNNNNNQNSSSNNSNNNSTNQTNNTNQQPTKQNDPTFDRNNASFQDYYKRAMAAKDAGNYDQAENLLNSAISVAVNDAQRDNAKAWLAEVQKAKNNSSAQASNAEAQRKQQQFKQLQEQQRQQYNNTVTQGNTNLQNGNYTGAIQSYTNAINSATTKSEKNLAATGAVVSSAFGVFDAIAKAKEEKRKKEQQERLEQERLQKIKEQKIALANEAMEGEWKFAKQYADLESEEGYKKAIEMMLPYANSDKLTGSTLNTIGFWYWKLEDYKNAMTWYIKASGKGESTADFNIGVLYFNGMGVEKNRGLALTHFQKACIGGDENGCEVFKSKREDLENEIKETITKDSYKEIYYLAESYYLEKNYQKALEFYAQSYEMSNTQDMLKSLKIADMCFDEKLLNDKVSAAKWYAIAINLMETRLKENSNLKTNSWFDEKYTEALYHYAYSVKQLDGKLAIDTYLKAVREGSTGAYTAVAVIYELGQGGIDKDWNQAKLFYEKDAEKNSPRAMYFLGQLYEKGGPNLEISEREAKKWFKKACKADKKYCK